MKEKNVTGVLVNPLLRSVKRVTIPNTLEGYYSVIETDIVEMPYHIIGDKTFTIICDENGKMVDKPAISALDQYAQPMLVGNLLVVNTVDGHIASLSESEITYVMQHVKKLPTKNYPEGLAMLFPVRYV